MTIKNNGGSAFPVNDTYHGGLGNIERGEPGMTLRDYFAAMAMQSLPGDSHQFKNFHRLLCERFGYTHDERDWRRDQISLIEHIAALTATGGRDTDAARDVLAERQRQINVEGWTPDHDATQRVAAPTGGEA